MDTASALVAWRELLGERRCSDAPAVRARHARSMQGTAPAPSCVLHPESTEEVQGVARIAGRYGVPLFPISRGKNFGYGDAAVLREGGAIVDLSGMNRILEINKTLAYAVLEPGVSQQELFEALRREAPELCMDSTGAGLDASIVGNALERGFGHTPYGDHCRTTCALEVVLADGRVMRTGFGHYAEARAAAVFPYGVGPSLNELFTQSNFGIVTRLTLWLAPKPEAFRCFYLLADREEALGDIVEALRPLRLRGIINSAVHIGNDLRVISSQRRYPWEETGGVTPLPEAVRQKLRQAAGLGVWNLTGSLSGTRGQVRGAARAVRAALKPLGRFVFVDDARIALAQRALGMLQLLGRGGTLASKLEALLPNYGLLRGVPTNAPLRGVYWRLRGTPGELPLDPLESSCGLYWISPVLPLLGEDAQRVLEIVTPVFRQHGFEVLITFTLLNERSMVAVINVSFDRNDVDESARAQSCYEVSLAGLLAQGYVPYRTGPSGFQKLAGADDVFWQVSGLIKRALDPQGIISPGRYIPEQD